MAILFVLVPQIHYAPGQKIRILIFWNYREEYMLNVYGDNL